MSERKETIVEAIERFNIAVGALVKPFIASMQRILDWLSPFVAHLQAKELERQGRLCRDKRKRNRYFRKAKRLRRDYPLGKHG